MARRRSSAYRRSCRNTLLQLSGAPCSTTSNQTQHPTPTGHQVRQPSTCVAYPLKTKRIAQLRQAVAQQTCTFFGSLLLARMCSPGRRQPCRNTSLQLSGALRFYNINKSNIQPLQDIKRANQVLASTENYKILGVLLPTASVTFLKQIPTIRSDSKLRAQAN